MNLILKRTDFTDKSTIGELTINGKFICYVLEDKDRGLKDLMDVKEISRLKLFGVTAIPYGTYKVDLTMSNRFKKVLPILYKVKGFEGIRIHSGNTAEHSLGCLIVGRKKGVNKVTESLLAMGDLMSILEHVPDHEEITISIIR
jgi:hypothetical protein